MDADSTFTHPEACRRASARAQRLAAYVNVVNAGDGEFAVADEDDLDTWWLGSSVVAAFEPDGSRSD